MLEFHRACRVEKLSDGSAVECVIGTAVIAVAACDGEYFAIDGMCAHQGGPIAQGRIKSGCVTCPWHGWQYDLRNGRNMATNQVMLSVYRTRVVDEWIEVEIEKA